MTRKSKYDGYFQPGQKIGDWTVVDGLVHLDERGRAKVVCECSCDRATVERVSCRNLSTGKSTRCKFCNYYVKRKRTGNPNWKGTEYVPKSILTSISHSCSRTGTPYNLDLSSATNLYVSSSGTCTFTGYSITPGEDSTLVRLNPNAGYVLGNVIWAHNTVANTVDELGAEEFKTTCYAVASHTNRQKE